MRQESTGDRERPGLQASARFPSRMAGVERLGCPPSSPHASEEDRGAQVARAAGAGRPLPGGSVLPHLRGLKGPRGGAGGPVQGGGAAHQSRGGRLGAPLPPPVSSPLPLPCPSSSSSSAAAAGLSRGGGGGGGCLASSRSLGNATSSPCARERGGEGAGRGPRPCGPEPGRAPRGCRGNGMRSGRPSGDGGGRRRHAEGGGRLALS